jgi:hypothetical protein
MKICPEVNKYLAYGNNPFLRIRQKVDGSIFVIFLDPKFSSQGNPTPSENSMQFHYSWEGAEYHIRYKDDVNKKGGKKHPTPIIPLGYLHTDVKLANFVLTDTTAKREPIEKIIHPILLDINPSKYGVFLWIRIWMNCSKNFFQDSRQDVAVDRDFIKPITVLVQQQDNKLNPKIELMI